MGFEVLMLAASVVGSVVSGVQGMQAANAQAAAIESQRAEEGLAQSKSELDRTRALEGLLAEQRVGFAAAGVDPNAGTPVTIGNVSRDRAAQDLTLDRALAAARDRRLQLSAKASRREGAMSLVGSFVGAGTSVAKFGAGGGFDSPKGAPVWPGV